jgi:hypothetical protein
MAKLLAPLLALIVLGGAFGEATVDGSPFGAGLRVEFEVVVAGAPAAVVVHIVDPGQSQSTISLGNRGQGVWAGTTDLDLMNFVVVFEVVYPDGTGEVSEPTTLLGLGLDPSLLGMGPVVTSAPDDGEQPLSAATRRWGWGAAALAAIALSLLAVWAMGDRVTGDDAGSEPLDSPVADESQPI